ncbi:prolyl-tRNA synthetase associated domain-containing protein [Desulforhopalus singaporensis]|uniref:Ala-tRNA(Pro) hydrolase n=1 Tax=Desulforhopalus singaporensis TaxID=91360 RepID=A0A1H0KGV3_9BACT|nr:prolyl-tRNA synthetase associated domain-containing protein [Desulforhopalus singaporensis]SDO54991.1 Ala-tRNA(Pro) hydrolase [Desulforhopalus singaporensis]
MLQTQQQLLAVLDENQIDYQNHEHPAVYTVEEAARHSDGIDGAHSKNLFLKDKKKNLFLVVTLADKPVVLKEVATKIGAKHLSFGKPELLGEVLGVIPGAVTPFAVINSNGHPLKVILDREMMDSGTLNFHPLENTATTTISAENLIRFIEYCGVDYEVTLL